MSSFFKKYFCAVIGLSALVSVSESLFAQTAAIPKGAAELSAIAQQRASIEKDKKEILDQFENESQACWKNFAVNDCLAKARQIKYQNLVPLNQREIALNTRQRALKEAERQQRLADKADDTSKDKATP